ncbi:hypothetical protein DMUE_5010 [Dictyocoela muelleri]|nr:hypothetical protein DMUE_5010 [Dictyocoela muelleri]
MNVINDKITNFRKRMNINIVEGDIPENVKFTYSNEILLQFDSGINDPERYLIFTTKTHLTYLNNANNLYCDGTFRAYPRNFTQIYVIMADIKNIIVPLVYIFMKTKSKNSYKKALNFLKSKMEK